MDFDFCDIDLIASRDESTNEVLKEGIPTLFSFFCENVLCTYAYMQPACASLVLRLRALANTLNLQYSINDSDFDEETLPLQYM
jgi:hypothetical protein